MKNKSTVTIKDVAKRAGVAASTVSRVINNKSLISEETREKIMEAMRELNYFPNSLARNFANGNACAIALAIDANDNTTFSNVFFNKSVFGIETVAQNNGYNILITNGKEEKGGVSSIEKLILERKIDGLILPSVMAKRKLIKKLFELDFPFVILGEPENFKLESSWVDINNIQGGELAVNHLIQKGYKRIAFLSSNPKAIFSQNRLAGYKQALTFAGFDVNEKYIASCEETLPAGYNLLKEVFKTSSLPDAVICSDNITAFGVLRAASEMGISVPRELGVLSFDNYPIAEYTNPPLTVVDVDTYSLGEQAASILIRKIEREKEVNQQTLISTRIISRESTNLKGELL